MSEPNLGRDIKIKRTRKGLGSRELSRLVGKAETYISQLERGLIKNPDYSTLYEIYKHLDQKDIEQFLYNVYNIESPEAEEARFRGAEEEADYANDHPDEYLQSQIEEYERQQLLDELNAIRQADLQLEWLENKEAELKTKNEKIKKELSFFIDKNLDTFTGVINNVYNIVMSMRKSKEDYDFFTNLFKHDISNFSEESKKRVIEAIKEEYKKSHTGGFGEPPRW